MAAYEAARTGTATEARELALQALADGQLHEDPGPESGGFWIAPFALLLAHADDDETRVTTEVIEWAKQHGSLPAFSMAAQLRAYAYLRLRLAGRRGGGCAERARASCRAGFPALRAHRARQRSARTRTADRSERRLRGGSPEPTAAGHIRYLQTRARLRAALQRPEDALEDLFECGRLEDEWEIRTPAFGTWRADAAPLLASLGRRDEARALAHEELERCRAFGAPGPLGISLRTLGLVEPGDAGIELLEQSAVQLERSSRRLEHAISLLELGAAIRRAGRRADARKPLREALELARACGAAAVAVRAHDELVTAGARPRRDPTESRSTLTPSELRVARMAAEGMTNREIAQGLFLTENTIETHLRSVFRKLDIRSRSQLARAL